jgi:uncharacterized membrane protein
MSEMELFEEKRHISLGYPVTDGFLFGLGFMMAILFVAALVILVILLMQQLGVVATLPFP